MSKIEDKVEKLLKNGRMQYIKEYSFSNLTGKKSVPLRFDFAIFLHSHLWFLIEVDGRQHYEFVKQFHKTHSGFLRCQERDRIKNAYCLAHKIPLIRIPYWDINDSLTLDEIMSNPKYRVNTKFFNDILRNKR